MTDRVTLDTSRISMGEAIAALSALLLFVFLFVDWFGAFNAWEVFDVVDIVFTLVALLVFAVVGARALGVVLRRPADPARFITWAGLIVLVVVLTVLFETDADREVGIFLGLLAAIGIVAGGLMASGELAGFARTAAGRPSGAPAPRDAAAAPTIADTDPRPPQPSPPEPADRPGPPGAGPRDRPGPPGPGPR